MGAITRGQAGPAAIDRLIGLVRTWIWPLGGLALGWLTLRGVDLGATSQSLASANPLLVALALVGVALTLLAKAARWRLLFGPQHPAPSLGRLAAALVVGQMANTILPARMGEPARAYLIGRMGPGVSYVLGTVAVEKVVDGLMAALVLASLAPFVVLPAWFWGPGISLVVLAFLLLGLNLALVWQRQRVAWGVLRLEKWVPERWRGSLHGRVQSGLDGLASLLRAGTGPGLWGWSVLAWVAAVLTNYFTLLALGIQLPLAASAFLLLVLQLGVAIPASLGRLGAFLYLAALGLSLFAVERSLALSFGLALFAIVYVPPVAVGAVLLWLQTRRQDN